MKKITVAMMVLCTGLLFADNSSDGTGWNSGEWADGEWVNMAVEASGVDSGTIIDGILKGLEMVELKKGYKSPIGPAERAKIINSVNARHGKIWIPRKLSTVIGRLEEILGYAKKGLEAFDKAKGAAEDALFVGKVIGIALGAKSLDDAAEIFASERMFQDSAFGEAGYWISTIAVGLFNGRSFTQAITDGYDEKNIGKWTKAGAKAGEWFANIVNSMPWKEAERKAVDKAFRDSLIRQGINKEGLAVIDKWLALDRETRVKMPIKVDSSWFEKKNVSPGDDGDGGGNVCKPGDEPDPFDTTPGGSNGDSDSNRRYQGLKQLKLID